MYVTVCEAESMFEARKSANARVKLSAHKLWGSSSGSIQFGYKDPLV